MQEGTGIAHMITDGEAILGIELGSTRIKAVLIAPDSTPIASGGFGWENSLDDGIWTYSLDLVWEGLQASFRKLVEDVKGQYGIELKKLKAFGISGMMHGFMVFDADGKLLTPFRTWRNNITGQASAELAELFSYPIPQRWSIAHLYQSILGDEAYIGQIDYMTTLAGYIHWKLTGKRVIGVGEASGMFPIDIATGSFNTTMIETFDAQVAGKQYGWKLGEILPEVLSAGAAAGTLTEAGAALLDPTGTLEAGIPMCPPEGDAGTGMVATNSVAQRTGNVSAGTSVFAMLVLEKELSKVHHEIDLVTTPDGSLVAMAHSNNCTSEYDQWVSLFGEVIKATGGEISIGKLYDDLLYLALTGDADCGGLLAYGYISGEHMTGFSEGRPLFARESNSSFTLANFMRAQLFTSLCALRTGLDILTEEEKVSVEKITGHGGFFKTAAVGQRIMAAATNTPISVLETAGEGGAWGIALLAAYMADPQGKSLPEYLEGVFGTEAAAPVEPVAADVEGFNQFFARYHKGLPIEQAAVDNLA